MATSGSLPILTQHVKHESKENLFWAFAYNVAALLMDAAGLLNPMLAGVARWPSPRCSLSATAYDGAVSKLRGFKSLGSAIATPVGAAEIAAEKA